MKTDAINRRLRFAPPQPLEEEIAISPNDHIYFEAINRHGPLPTRILQAFTKDKNYAALQRRWTKFYHGTNGSDPLFFRHPEQFNSFKARYQDTVHDNTPLARELLKERGVEIIKRTDPFVHRLFGACATASLELTARELGKTYQGRQPILAEKGASLAIEIDGKITVPDELLSIGNNYFACEWDRNTESIERTDVVPNTIDKKMRRYLDVMHYEAFKKHWGISNFRVLFLTTDQTRKASIMKHLDETTASGLKKRFLFKVSPYFGRRWEMPKGVMKELLTEPWDSLAGPIHLV